MIRSRELGTSSADVVCFSANNLQRLADRLGVTFDALVHHYDGVSCGLGDEGYFGIDLMTAIDVDGNTNSVVMIGGRPNTFKRFLEETDQSFDEFYHAHPRYAEVGKDEQFNWELFGLISSQHRATLLMKAPNAAREESSGC